MPSTAVAPLVSTLSAGGSKPGLVNATLTRGWAEKVSPGAQPTLASCVDSMNIVPCVVAAFRDRRSLLTQHKEDLAGGRIILPRALAVETGSVVCVDIGIADESLWVQALASARPESPPVAAKAGSVALHFLTASRSLANALLQEDDTASALFLCRRARRFYAFFDATCSCSEQRFPGRVRDISRTGLFLLTQVFVPVGKQIDLRLLPECRDSMVVTATVARHASNGMGVSFVSCPQEQVPVVREFYRRIQDRAMRLEGKVPTSGRPCV